MEEKMIFLKNKYIAKTRLYNKSLDEGHDFKRTNKLAKECIKIGEDIFENTFYPYIYIYILREAPDLYSNVLTCLHIGDFEQFKKIFERKHQINNDFRDQLLLEKWDDFKKRKLISYKDEIEKYNQWKKDNPDKHQEILDEFNKILDKLKEKL